MTNTCKALCALALLFVAGRAVADGTTPGKPWFRQGSTVTKAVLCDGLDDQGQPRHPGQTFTTRQRVIALSLSVDPGIISYTYTVVWTRFGKSIMEKTWTVNTAMRRLFTIVPNNSSQHLPGPYQVEVREEGLAVVRIPFVVTEPQ